MLEKPIRHLLQRQPDVLEAELLAGDIERHMRKAADASSASPAPARCRRRRRRRTPAAPGAGDGCWQAPAPRARRPPAFRCRCGRTAGISGGSRKSGNCRADRAFRWHLKPARRRHAAGHRCGHIGLDPVQRVDGDALALAQAVHQLAVVDGAPAERRFRHIRLAAELGDLAEDFVVLHEVGRGGQKDWVLPLSKICPLRE
jgi:hypothetical protein